MADLSSSRLLSVLALTLATATAAFPEDARPPSPLFSSYSVLHVRLEAPLTDLFAATTS